MPNVLSAEQNHHYQLTRLSSGRRLELEKAVDNIGQGKLVGADDQ